MVEPQLRLLQESLPLLSDEELVLRDYKCQHDFPFDKVERRKRPKRELDLSEECT